MAERIDCAIKGESVGWYAILLSHWSTAETPMVGVLVPQKTMPRADNKYPHAIFCEHCLIVVCLTAAAAITVPERSAM